MFTSTNRKSWLTQEDKTIKTLVQIYGIQDWTQISNRLKEEYPESLRSGKQCRQRWYNHLSPAISKNPWSPEEETKLFQRHRDQGNKWKDISKQFVGRTDNDLKNHFYSTLRKSLRRLNKSLGQKNSTSQMREIKPSVLSTIMHHIYCGQSQNNLLLSLKDVPSLIFEFANIKPQKSGLSIKNDQMRDKVLRIFDLISQFNDQYQKGKSTKKQRILHKKQKNQKCEKKSSKQKLTLKSFQVGELDSILSTSTFSLKLQTLNTQISTGYSSSNNQCQIEQPQDDMDYQQVQDYQFMFIKQRSGILDQMDEIIRHQFSDPEEPSAINDQENTDSFFQKSFCTKSNQQSQCCHKIVDQLLDGPINLKFYR